MEELKLFSHCTVSHNLNFFTRYLNRAIITSILQIKQIPFIYPSKEKVSFGKEKGIITSHTKNRNAKVSCNLYSGK